MKEGGERIKGDEGGRVGEKGRQGKKEGKRKEA